MERKIRMVCSRCTPLLWIFSISISTSAAPPSSRKLMPLRLAFSDTLQVEQMSEMALCMQTDLQSASVKCIILLNFYLFLPFAYYLIKRCTFYFNSLLSLKVYTLTWNYMLSELCTIGKKTVSRSGERLGLLNMCLTLEDFGNDVNNHWLNFEKVVWYQKWY